MKPVDLRPRDRATSDAADDGEARTAVCPYHPHSAHGAVRGEQSPPPSPHTFPVSSAASARAYVRAVVQGHGYSPSRKPTEQALTDLLLVTSELVSNAIRHGGGLVAFEATLTPDGVRLVVHDRSEVIPSAAFGSGELPTGQDGGGFGWPLIIKLARDIVIERCAGGGKVVSVLVPLA